MKMSFSFKFKRDAKEHLEQLKNAMPNASHFIQNTKRSIKYPFEIVTIHKGKKYYSGSSVEGNSITSRIKKILNR